jgi:Uma2 family endonuclease
LIVYPESDGKPMADNTKQLRWIIVLVGNLTAMFRDREDVFVGGNQFWYPVEGEPDVKMAPDAYVVFGRPKRDRPSWQQWVEDGVPMTVVFEIESPGNEPMEMDDKTEFYDEHGAEEYYWYNPETNRLKVFVRQGTVFRRQRRVNGFVSPRLGIRFDLSGPELVVYAPDGRRFLTFEELEAARNAAEERAAQSDARAQRTEQRATRMAELILRSQQGQASPEELQELQRLIQEQLQPPTS